MWVTLWAEHESRGSSEAESEACSGPSKLPKTGAGRPQVVVTWPAANVHRLGAAVVGALFGPTSGATYTRGRDDGAPPCRRCPMRTEPPVSAAKKHAAFCKAEAPRTSFGELGGTKAAAELHERSIRFKGGPLDERSTRFKGGVVDELSTRSLSSPFDERSTRATKRSTQDERSTGARRAWLQRSCSAMTAALHENRSARLTKGPGAHHGDEPSPDTGHWAVPTVAAKVQKAWYTRQDKFGSSIVMQVEEGLVNDRLQPPPPSRRRSLTPALGVCLTRWLGSKRVLWIHPFSPVMRLWEHAVLTASVFYVVAAPLRVAFPSLTPTSATPGGLTADACAALLMGCDLVLRAFVAYEDDASLYEPTATSSNIFASAASSNLVVDRAHILRRYVGSVRFWSSLTSALPLDLLLLALVDGGGGHERALLVYVAGNGTLGSVDAGWGGGVYDWSDQQPGLPIYLGLLRVASLVNVWLYFERWDWQAVDHTVVDRLAKNVLIGIVLLHWLACGWVLVARSSRQAGYQSTFLSEAFEQACARRRIARAIARLTSSCHCSLPWRHAALLTSRGRSRLCADLRDNGATESVVYVRALSWAATTASGLGTFESGARCIPESLFLCFTTTVGTAFFLFTVGSITSIVSAVDPLTAQTRAQFIAAKLWMARAQLPPEVRLRVLEHFYAKFVIARKGSMHDRAMLRGLPRSLQYEVTLATRINHEIVATTALFRGCSQDAVATMIERLSPHRCLPHDVMVRHGENGSEMYIIKAVSGAEWGPACALIRIQIVPRLWSRLRPDCGRDCPRLWSEIAP